MAWGHFQANGHKFDLGHLDPFTVRLESALPSGGHWRLRVSFGAHVFTRSWMDGDPPEMHFQDGATSRCFCPKRCAHSVYLPEVFRRAALGRVFLTSKERFAFVANPPGAAQPYSVFFKMRRATKNYDALVDVVSAYERPHLKGVKGMPFQRAVDLIASGAGFEWPKK